MKKIITALLAAVFAFSFCACDTSSDNTENSDSFPARIPAWSADEPLLPAGLLGPVRVIRMEE